jgi:hypothetical protein
MLSKCCHPKPTILMHNYYFYTIDKSKLEKNQNYDFPYMCIFLIIIFCHIIIMIFNDFSLYDNVFKMWFEPSSPSTQSAFAIQPLIQMMIKNVSVKYINTHIFWICAL